MRVGRTIPPAASPIYIRDIGNGLKGIIRDSKALNRFRNELKDYFDVKVRYNKAKQLLEEHKDNIYDVLSKDDPMAALGVLYPLAVFFKHGKVNLELITGEGGPGGEDEE